MNLPNKLTVLRVILIPFFMAALLIDKLPFNVFIALAFLPYENMKVLYLYMILL